MLLKNIKVTISPARVSPRPTRGQLEVACRQLASSFGMEGEEEEKFAKAVFDLAIGSIMTTRAVMAYARFMLRVQNVMYIVAGRARDGEKKVNEYNNNLETAREEDEDEAGKDEDEAGKDKDRKEYLLLTALPRGERVDLNKAQKDSVVKEISTALLASIPPKSALHEDARKVIIGNRGLNQGFALWLIEMTSDPQDWVDFRENLEALAGKDEGGEGEDEDGDDEDGDDENNAA